MITQSRFALVLALALGSSAVGCSSAADPSTNGDDNGADGNGDGSTDGDQKKPLDASGTYAMHSSFDLATHAPGKVGEVVNTIIAATNDPDDPSRWILEQAIAQISNSTVRGALNLAKELAVGWLNDELLDVAPDFFSTMIQIGNDFGDIAQHFGLNETLTLTGSGGAYTATHTVTGAHFKLGTQELDFSLANYNVANIVVDNIAVTMDATGQLTIAPHTISLTYGKLLRIGLDGAIIPFIDASAHNLNELLAHQVDCPAIGTGVAGAIGFPSFAGAISSACTLGLNAAANYVYTKIDSLDSTALQFAIGGSVRGMDKNGDRSIDTLVTGSWTGTLAYGSTPSDLVPAAFYGERH